MEQERKLAAILFADIVGYTALMQKGETTAMSILNRFETITQKAVEKHAGEIIKTYGDGSLLLFPSTVNAVQCAYEMQQAFQSAPKVPLRIGIHVGEIIRKGKDIFGNGVNIASRVESMGVAGSVLLSKNAEEKIRNQEGFQTQSLGIFDFKNVEEPMEVFALANEGLAIPNKEKITGKLKTPISKRNKWLLPTIIGTLLLGILGYWQWNNTSSLTLSETNSKEPTQTPLSKEIREKRVAVMVFDNQTMSEELDAFGKMISDWVTRGLMETGEANVISAANIQHQIAKAGLGQGANPEFASNTGVDVMLQGRYYLQENRLIIHANIVEIASGEVIHALAPIEGDKGEMIDLLDQLTQEVLGYWAVKKAKRFQQNPPKYEAYKTFEKAQAAWYDDSQYKNSERLLKKAYQLDTTFYAPLLKLIPLYLNSRKFESIDSVFNFINNIQPNFNEWERLRFEYFKQTLAGNHLEAGHLGRKRYLLDPSDGSANNNAALSFLQANHPQKALDVLLAYDVRYRNMDDLRSSRENWLTTAYILLGDYGAVIKIMENYSFPTFTRITLQNHLFALAKLEQHDALIPVIEKYHKMGVYNQGKKLSAAYLYNALCNILKLLGQQDLLLEHAQTLMNIAQKDTSNTNRLLNMADAAIYLEDWSQAQAFLEAYQNQVDISGNFDVLSKIGVVYVKLGQTEKVNQILTAFNTTKGFKKDNLYYKARIQATLGDKSAAMESLEEAFQLGRGFAIDYNYHFDSFLLPLFDYPPFMEFVKPKG